MSMAKRLKDGGSMILGLAAFLALMAIGIGLLTGAAAFSLWVLKWTFPASVITLLISVFLLTPLSLVPATRGLSAVGFMIASFAFGAILWVWGMSYTYSVWGLFGVIVGLVFFGVGVVPVAMFAALVHGDWGNLGMFVAALVLTVGSRALANWLAEKSDERAARLHSPEITVQAYEVPEGATSLE